MLVRHRLGRGVLLVGVLVGIASVAYAGDVQIVHGNACRQLLGDHEEPTYWLLSGFSAAAPWAPINSAPHSVNVVCPLVRDSTRTDGLGRGLGLASLRVRGYAPNVTGPLICTAALLNGVNGVTVPGSTVTKTSGTIGNVLLDFGVLFKEMGNGESVYQLKCNVAADGTIFSIRYDEVE